jgi:hypothetical protein
VWVGPKDRTLFRRRNTSPPFRRIIGLDDRVFCRVKMFCGVSIWRLIATIDMATAAADRRCNQGSPNFRHSFAPQGARNNVTDCREMFAKYRHVFPTRAIRAALRLSRFQSDCEAPLRHVLERSSRKLRIDRHDHGFLGMATDALARDNRQRKHPRMLPFRQHIHENRFPVLLVDSQLRLYLMSRSNASSVPGSRHTAKPGSLFAAKPRVDVP